jgi:hypothetical protein
MNDHVKVQELLPWFVNGSLNEGEQSLVDSHLPGCEVCRTAVEQLIAVSARFNVADEMRMEEVSRAADAFVKRLPPRSKRLAGSAWRQPALAVCGAFVIGLVIWFAFPNEDRFRALSRTSVESAVGPVIQIVFSPEATEKAIRGILLHDGNRVLSGPSRQGVYRVALGEGQRSDIFVARLRRDPDVIFAAEEK